jgi:hypothetical protein
VVAESNVGGKRVGNFEGAPTDRDAPIARELRYLAAAVLVSLQRSTGALRHLLRGAPNREI